MFIYDEDAALREEIETNNYIFVKEALNKAGYKITEDENQRITVIRPDDESFLISFIGRTVRFLSIYGWRYDNINHMHEGVKELINLENYMPNTKVYLQEGDEIHNIIVDILFDFVMPPAYCPVEVLATYIDAICNDIVTTKEVLDDDFNELSQKVSAKAEILTGYGPVCMN